MGFTNRWDMGPSYWRDNGNTENIVRVEAWRAESDYPGNERLIQANQAKIHGETGTGGGAPSQQVSTKKSGWFGLGKGPF
jgi:hypothetical protein